MEIQVSIERSNNKTVDVNIERGSVKLLQNITISPSTLPVIVTADTPYYGLGIVTVEAAPLQSKTVEYEGGTVEVTPDSNFLGMSSVTIIPPVIPPSYLTFTNVNNGISTISMQKIGEAPDVNIEYSLDNGLNWNMFVVGDTVISLDVDESVKLRGFNNTFASSISDINNFVMTGIISSSGDITSLLNGEGGDVELVEPFVFVGLFGDCTSLVVAPDMPSKVLSVYCYANMYRNSGITKTPYLPAKSVPYNAYRTMFYKCADLVEATELPATSLGQYAYYNMFAYCSSLRITPSVLPAVLILEYTYQYMFRYCTSLLHAPHIMAKTISAYSLMSMYQGCSSLVDSPDLHFADIPSYGLQNMFRECTSLTKAPSLSTVESVDTYGLSGTFYGCTSLEVAPEMDITTLTGSYNLYTMFRGCTSLVDVDNLTFGDIQLPERVYSQMFYGCRSLTKAPLLQSTHFGDNYVYMEMFRGCTSLVDVQEELPAMTLQTTCYAYMYYGCSSLVNAPKLPALTGAYQCYRYMFYNCSSLKKVIVLATPNSVNLITDAWMTGVPAGGTFYKRTGTTWPTGSSGVPSSWTVEDYIE